MTRKEMIAFPMYYCKQVIFEEKLITIEYNPAYPFDEEGFVDLVKKIYKKGLCAHSVEVVSRIKEITNVVKFPSDAEDMRG